MAWGKKLMLTDPGSPIERTLGSPSGRLELGQTLWDSIAAEQSGPELTGADRSLQCLQPAELAGAREARVSQALQDPHELQPRW
jgi:hypothetical protein